MLESHERVRGSQAQPNDAPNFAPVYLELQAEQSSQMPLVLKEQIRQRGIRLIHVMSTIVDELSTMPDPPLDSRLLDYAGHAEPLRYPKRLESPLELDVLDADSVSIVHADLQHENVLTSTNGIRIVDWDDAQFGWIGVGLNIAAFEYPPHGGAGILDKLAQISASSPHGDRVIPMARVSAYLELAIFARKLRRLQRPLDRFRQYVFAWANRYREILE